MNGEDTSAGSDLGGRLGELRHRHVQLQQREREILELTYLRRTNGIEAVRDAVRRLGELGSPSGVIARAPYELGIGVEFDRVLLSEVDRDRLVPLRLWERGFDDPAPPEVSVVLEYPLVEYQVVRNRAAELVIVDAAGGRSPQVLTDSLLWTSYVVAPVVAEGDVIGLLHADASASGRTVDELDRELLAEACTGLGEVFGRAVLRQLLQRHRSELQSAMTLLGGQLRSATSSLATRGSTSRVVGISLTARELEVLSAMARGRTNGQIAAALGVREGTVKYHVKNILRKLGARSRADAVARYARLAGAMD